MFSLDTSPSARAAMLTSLPESVVSPLLNPKKDKSSQISKLIQDLKCKKLRKSVSAIVSKYSRTQSLKGVLTAGGVKTVVYIWQKLRRTYLK